VTAPPSLPRPSPLPSVVSGSFGITALAHTLADRARVEQAAPDYTSNLRKLRSWGYRAFHVAEAGTGLTDLAVRAGELALDKAGLAASEVDLIVLAIADIAEYLYWDPAASTQARLGAQRAEALLINQACGAGVVAWDAVAGKFATHPEYRTALVVTANRVCDAYWNRMESNTCVSSDGAAAAIAVRGHEGCRWLTTEVISDGRYADFFRMEVGGEAQPFTTNLAEQTRVINPFDRLERFFRTDLAQMLEFSTTLRARMGEVVQRACERVGLPTSAVRRVIHLNDNLKALTALASDLSLPLERTNVELSMEHGHLGSADQLFCLDRYLAAGDLELGDVVALTSLSSGMHWVCTLLRI
jgi:3-oxoacyl-[acyl-carrier-protein] synthase-3